jgi:hypothetical protein
MIRQHVLYYTIAAHGNSLTAEEVVPGHLTRGHVLLVVVAHVYSGLAAPDLLDQRPVAVIGERHRLAVDRDRRQPVS